VRLVTFNVLHGRSPADGRVDLERFGAAVRDLDADVLALQEVDRDQPRSQGADLTAVAAEAMGAQSARFLPALVGTPGAWVRADGGEPAGTPGYGVALLTRLPVLEAWDVRLPALRGQVPTFFRGRRGPVLVRDEPRVAAVARLDAPGGPLTVVSTHLSFVPGWNAVQLRRLAGAVRAQPRLVLMGDLNLGPGPVAALTRLRPLARGLTFPAHAPDRQLDHVLGRGSLPVTGTAVRPMALSDHCALVVDLR
jgi:endonuclease/exonuclease/phosphatase family metal-dependent hydrolase